MSTFTYHGGGVLFVTHPARASGSGRQEAERMTRNEPGGTLTFSLAPGQTAPPPPDSSDGT